MNAGDGHGRALEHIPVAIGRTEYRYIGRTVAIVVGGGSNVRRKAPSDNACVAIERVGDPPLTVAVDREVKASVAIEVAADRFVSCETPICNSHARVRAAKDIPSAIAVNRDVSLSISIVVSLNRTIAR